MDADGDEGSHDSTVDKPLDGRIVPIVSRELMTSSRPQFKLTLSYVGPYPHNSYSMFESIVCLTEKCLRTRTKE